jgi:hypothetical protein
MQRSRILLVAVSYAMIATTRTLAWSSSRAILRSSTSCTTAARYQHLSAPTSFALRSFSESTPPEKSSNGGGGGGNDIEFTPGDKIQIEIISFGPLGASVEIIGTSHDPDDLIPEDEPPLALGLILQKEIQFFRAARNNIDVVRGEVLPAYVEKVRDDQRVDVGLRAFGGRAKADIVSTMIMDRLDLIGTLAVGDKSHPDDINAEFPGVSKSSFKRAVSALYKEGKVLPSPHSVTLVK